MLMWRALLLGWTPPNEVSEQLYADLRHAPPSPLRGFVGFACSFGGKWFGGFARDRKGDSGRPGVLRDYAAVGSRVCLEKVATFRRARVRLHRRSFYDWRFEPGTVVYLDPPYQDTEEYGAHDGFDHSRFWARAHELAQQDVFVVVSESTPPPVEGWTTVWSVVREINVTRIEGQSPGQIFDGLYVPEWLAHSASAAVGA